MDVQQQKRELRATSRQRAEAILPHCEAWSIELCRQILSSDTYRAAGYVMLFLPLPPPAVEPDLTELACDTLASGRCLCLPRVDWESGAMEAAAVTSLRTLVSTRHGVREPPPPPASHPVPIEKLDLIFVPGLAFDVSGNRLGRGAGYYDRFLSGCRPGTPICGVCFEAQLVDRIPTDSWDIPVNALATERRWITLRG